MGRKSRAKAERRAREAEFKRAYVNPPRVKCPVRPRPSAGSTGSERALTKLACETFLSLWSYPNVVRDEPQGKGAIGKEIADQLVVFEDDVVLFSDNDGAPVIVFQHERDEFQDLLRTAGLLPANPLGS
jgi:hypothetical protein